MVIKPNSKGITIDSNTAPLIFQYNPETLTRNIFSIANEEILQKKATEQDSNSIVELINLSLEFDATDQLKQPNQYEDIAQKGLYPTLATLESIIHSQFKTGNMMSPVVLFLWGSNRIIPVWLENLKVTEEAFDSNLNPIRVRIELNMRVRDLSQLTKGSLGYDIYARYLENRKMLTRVYSENKKNRELLKQMSQNIQQYAAIEKPQSKNPNKKRLQKLSD